MKTNYLYLVNLFLFVQFAFSQIGINTPAPASTLDVVATNPNGISSNVDGILIPRVTRERAQSMTSVPTSTMLYINDVVSGTAAGTTINVTSVGFYIFDGTSWQTMTGGQNSTSYFTTAGLVVTPSTGLTFTSGFPVTINVPANCVVNIAIDIGMQTLSPSTTGFSRVDIVLVVDGFALPDAAYQRINALNNASVTGTFQYASLSQSVVLSPGTHTVGIAAAGTGAGSNAAVGGNSSSVIQGELTVTFLKK